MPKTKDRLLDATGTARPYVERALTDEDVRDNLKSAFDTARTVYNELIGGRGTTAVATRVATDKELQESLKHIVEELRSAADRVQGRQEHKGRNTTLLVTGIALGILFNPMTGPATRAWLRERLFGGGDDFTYQGGSGGNSSSGGTAP
jgi:hypothetical protein